MNKHRLWINGIEGESGIIPDEGVFFGRGLFETIRIGKSAWFLEEHIDRPNKGAKALGLQRSLHADEIAKFISINDLRDCALRISLTAQNTMLASRPLPYPTDLALKGIRAMVGSIRKNPYSKLVYIKGMGYAENLLQREEARALGCEEAILLNTDGYLAEACGSNLFFVKDGKLFTPSIGCGLLPGVIRAWVAEAAEVAEGRYSLEELYGADEIFLTNSLMGIMGMKELLEYKGYNIGPTTRALQKKYLDFVANMYGG